MGMSGMGGGGGGSGSGPGMDLVMGTLTGILGPTAMGKKPPAPQAKEYARPSSTALQPKGYQDLLNLSMPATGTTGGGGAGGGAGIDPETMRMLQMLAGRGA